MLQQIARRRIAITSNVGCRAPDNGRTCCSCRTALWTTNHQNRTNHYISHAPTETTAAKTTRDPLASAGPQVPPVAFSELRRTIIGMSKLDTERERSRALRRSRVARQGIVLGAVAGSLGIAGVLGLSAAANPGAPAPSGTTTSTTQGNQGGSSNTPTPTQVRVYSGDDGGEHESDDGGGWVPAQPSPKFNTGGNTGGSAASGGHTPAPKPHATTGGSVVAP